MAKVLRLTVITFVPAYIYIYIIYKTSLMQPLIAFCAFLAWFLSRAVSTLRLLSGVSFIRKNIWQLSDCKANNLSSTFLILAIFPVRFQIWLSSN